MIWPFSSTCWLLFYFILFFSTLCKCWRIFLFLIRFLHRTTHDVIAISRFHGLVKLCGHSLTSLMIRWILQYHAILNLFKQYYIAQLSTIIKYLYDSQYIAINTAVLWFWMRIKKQSDWARVVMWCDFFCIS